jgi:MFS family permease
MPPITCYRGNTVQLAAAITRLFSGPDQGMSFHMADRLALTSLLTFAGGAFLGRIGDRIGSKTRLWVMGATALQAGFCAAAFVAFIVGDVASFATDRGDVAWHSVPAFIGLGFLSASMGMQGIVGKRLNTHYGTTVVLTTIWCELVADPKLFHFGR